jgi:hypothetical protein
MFLHLAYCPRRQGVKLLILKKRKLLADLIVYGKLKMTNEWEYFTILGFEYPHIVYDVPQVNVNLHMGEN